MAEPVIVFEHVCKDYPSGTHAIRDLSLTIRKGEFVFLVGSSGSGKSTFIRLLLKEIEPSSGRLYVNSKELTRMRRRQVPRYRRGIGVVFQNFRLLKDRSVFENVAFAQRIVGVSNVKIRRNVKNMLNMVELADRRNAFPKELSGGEQQRVAIARALVNNPVILLADEPTGNLDPKMSWEIMKLLDEINKKGTTVVVVTHNREIVDRMQKRVITLNRGVLVSDEKKGGYTYEH
ncbi:cell division ATP-binding protein FtsE [Anaerolentibacter hominis]|uniref:cell division ATP-binding protein FtsE n=1 Tax=Anaerolentibacter hominis TaxID=3079009 RepID=UPI0031B8B00B